MARAHLDPVYQFLYAYYEAHGRPPSNRDIMAALDLSYPQVGEAVFLLTGMGRIRKRIPVALLEQEAS